jgi:hypothetical protein
MPKFSKNIFLEAIFLGKKVKQLLEYLGISYLLKIEPSKLNKYFNKDSMNLLFNYGSVTIVHVSAYKMQYVPNLLIFFTFLTW